MNVGLPFLSIHPVSRVPSWSKGCDVYEKTEIAVRVRFHGLCLRRFYLIQRKDRRFARTPLGLVVKPKPHIYNGVYYCEWVLSKICIGFRFLCDWT